MRGPAHGSTLLSFSASGVKLRSKYVDDGQDVPLSGVMMPPSSDHRRSVSLRFGAQSSNGFEAAATKGTKPWENPAALI
jgi:hypothetical protein